MISDIHADNIANAGPEFQRFFFARAPASTQYRGFTFQRDSARTPKQQAQYLALVSLSSPARILSMLQNHHSLDADPTALHQAQHDEATALAQVNGLKRQISQKQLELQSAIADEQKARDTVGKDLGSVLSFGIANEIGISVAQGHQADIRTQIQKLQEQLSDAQAAYEQAQATTRQAQSDYDYANQQLRAQEEAQAQAQAQAAQDQAAQAQAAQDAAYRAQMAQRSQQSFATGYAPDDGSYDPTLQGDYSDTSDMLGPLYYWQGTPGDVEIDPKEIVDQTGDSLFLDHYADDTGLKVRGFNVPRSPWSHEQYYSVRAQSFDASYWYGADTSDLSSEPPQMLNLGGLIGDIVKDAPKISQDLGITKPPPQTNNDALLIALIAVAMLMRG